jgi:trigger factor
MQVTETLAEGLKRQFKIVLPATDIDSKVEGRLRQLSSSVRIPGFRPGKVPIAMMKQRYGQSVMGEVLEEAVQDSSNRALADRGLRPATQPKVQVTSFAEGSDLEYTLAIELMPEITPTDFAKLEVDKPKADVGEEEVQKALDGLAARRQSSKPVVEERPARADDILVIDFLGRLGGEEFAGGKGEDHSLKLGSGSFIPGFEDQLVGAKAGETREVTVSFPAEYHAADLAGKEAVFTVTVKELREPEAATVDEDFAKQLGFEELQGLRDAIKAQIEQEYSAAARLKVKRDLLDKLADSHDFPVPETLVEGEFEAIWKQVEQAKEKGQLEDEDKNKSDDELKAEYRGIAERRVRLGLLLAEVGRTNNIKISDDEVRRALFDEARRYPGQERQVLEFYKKNPGAVESLKAPIYEDKVIDFILEMAKVNERTVTPEELLAEEAETPAGEGKKRKA